MKEEFHNSIKIIKNKKTNFLILIKIKSKIYKNQTQKVEKVLNHIEIVKNHLNHKQEFHQDRKKH